MSSNRVLHKWETLYVENWRENLLVWLNWDLPKRYYTRPARDRIEALIAALQLLIRHRGPLRTMLRRSEVLHSVDMVQRASDRYPSWPVLMWDRNHNLSFGNDFRGMKEARSEEAEAALAAMRLAEVNELIWLRQCLCGRWFFACRKTQKSCSPTCRHKLYEQTDRFKSNRRKYMKRYYRLKRSGKVK
jgi:hypothetical protein